MLSALPNAISLSRIPASILLLATYNPASRTSLFFSIAVSVIIIGSDFVDGAIARRIGASSMRGYIIDGLGDRAFHLSALFVMVVGNAISFEVAWLGSFREIMAYAVRLLDSRWHSKQPKSFRFTTLCYVGVLRITFTFTILGGVFPENDLPLPEFLCEMVQPTLVIALIAAYIPPAIILLRAMREASNG